MRATQRWTTLVAGGAAALMMGLAGCASAGPADTSASGNGGEGGGEEIRIGALYLDSQGYYGGVKKGVQEAAAASGLNVKLVESSSAGDVAKESSFMSSLVSSGVSAIIISAVSTDGSVAAVKQAADAGIPVICYNTCVNEEATEQYVYAYILGDPIEFGRLAGDYAADFYTDKGVEDPKFGVLNCEQFEVCQQRMDGFTQGLQAKLPKAEVVSNQEGTEADKAISVGEQTLTANPTITGMYGQSGGATVGAFKSVQNRDLTGTVFAFGSDMTTDIATALGEGEVLQAVVDISGIEVGELAFAQAKGAIDGETAAEKVIQAPITLYTPDMAAEWLETHPDGLP
ncbi:MAG: substrate-binding domain-containing protein [Propioniciclava sp.]